MYPKPVAYTPQPVAAPPGYLTPDSRRALEEDRDKSGQQMLPSISEALGGEKPLAYHGPPTSAPQPQQALPPRSLSNVGRPADGPSGPPNPFNPPTAWRDQPFAQNPDQQRSSLVSVNTQDSRNASLHSLASSGKSPTQSTQTGVTSISGSQHSGHDYSAPPSAGSIASPNGYGGVPQAFTFQSQPPPNVPSYPTAHYPRPEDRVLQGRPMPGPYPGDANKRPLDIYDVEVALNEVCSPSISVYCADCQVADMSAQALEFSRYYALQAHHTQRSGPTNGSLPSTREVEDMLNMHRRNEDALMRIRAAVSSHEQAMAEMAQQRAFRPGMNEEDLSLYEAEYKGNGGFAGADTKKRRGVSCSSSFLYIANNHRKPHLPGAAIVAVESTHPNGVAVQTAHEPCATHAGFTTRN